MGLMKKSPSHQHPPPSSQFESDVAIKWSAIFVVVHVKANRHSKAISKTLIAVLVLCFQANPVIAASQLHNFAKHITETNTAPRARASTADSCATATLDLIPLTNCTFHEMLVLFQEEESVFRSLLSNMEAVYLNRNPTTKAVLELVRSVDNDQICYDHLAFRTFGKIIRKYTEASVGGSNYAALASALGSLTWEAPLFSEFQELARESNYAAWTLVNGFAVNHITISAHRLKSLLIHIRSLNQFVEENGFKLSSEGGVLKEVGQLLKPEESAILLQNVASNMAKISTVQLNLGIKAMMYNTTNAYYNCAVASGFCSLKFYSPSSIVLVLTSPGPEQVFWNQSSDFKLQSYFAHKESKRDGTIDALHANLNLTIPREPELETAIPQRTRLNFTWPQVSSMSGFPARGSGPVMICYKDQSSQIQKFALRFAVVCDTEAFMATLKELMEKLVSEISSQSDFVSFEEVAYRPVKDWNTEINTYKSIDQLESSFNGEVAHKSDLPTILRLTLYLSKMILSSN